jgi:hypothetical protein
VTLGYLKLGIIDVLGSCGRVLKFEIFHLSTIMLCDDIEGRKKWVEAKARMRGAETCTDSLGLQTEMYVFVNVCGHVSFFRFAEVSGR